MKIELRDPNVIMKLSRLGSFHQSKLSFLRSFLSEFKNWEYKRDLFELDKDGFGVAVYSFKKKERVLREIKDAFIQRKDMLISLASNMRAQGDMYLAETINKARKKGK